MFMYLDTGNYTSIKIEEYFRKMTAQRNSSFYISFPLCKLESSMFSVCTGIFLDVGH